MVIVPGVESLHLGLGRVGPDLATGVEQLQHEPGPAGERLVTELQRSMDAIEAEGGIEKIQGVVLTGRVERLQEFKGVVEQGLKLPVRLHSPWADAELSQGARAACERLPDVSFASLIGLAIAPSRLDLTPNTTKLRQAFEAKARTLVLLACQGVGALILISLLLIGQAHQEYRYYQALRQQHERSAQDVRQTQEAMQRVAFVEQRLRDRGELFAVSEVLAVSSPPDIRWEALTFVRGDAVVLKGVSEQLPKIYEFVADLNASPLFTQVEERRVAKRQSEGEAHLTDFEVSCSLRLPEPGS